MKKALSVLLSVLVIFSMVGVMAFAAEPPITVNFVDHDGKVLKTINVMPGAEINKYVPENPERPDTDTTDYTFAGWLDENGNLLHKSTIPVAPQLAEGETAKTVVYTASYTEKDTTGYQSFWNFIESIFERINMLFQYFAEIFNF